MFTMIVVGIRLLSFFVNAVKMRNFSPVMFPNIRFITNYNKTTSGFTSIELLNIAKKISIVLAFLVYLFEPN